MWTTSPSRRPIVRRGASRRDRRPLLESLETRQMLSTFTVTSTNDQGAGTLRQAILAANAAQGSSLINFNLPGAGPYTIALGSALPAITRPVVIDGTTQPGFAGRPLIELNGSAAGGGASGLDLEFGASGTATAHSAVKGLEIDMFRGSGVVLNAASYVDLSLDSIGVTSLGTAPNVTYTTKGNGGDGVVLSNNASHDSLNNCVVGYSGGSGVRMSTGATTNSVCSSTITANMGNGITITDPGTSSNLISSSQIGTGGGVSYQLPNGGDGVLVQNGASGNTVGGSAAGSGNLLSGNQVCGVYLKDAGTSGNLVAGNLIGTNAAGTAAVPNWINGIDVVSGASFNTIGGTTAGARNVISGNGYNGVVLAFAGTSSNLVEGNFIGTTASGVSPLANGADGVAIVGGANSNTIGGSTSAARNLISGNSGNGVDVSDPNSNNNVIAANFIGTDPGGTTAIANGGDGVFVHNGASGNTVGGSAAGSGNLVSGNLVCGVYLKDAGTSGNVVAGNLIGTNAAGTAAIANAIHGIDIVSGASFNTIGGTTAGARNVISGNVYDGVALVFAGTSSNLVEGNFIGTTASGGASLPNGGDGVGIVGGAAGNTIGGYSAAARNVISGNRGNGVNVQDQGTTRNTIAANYVGVDVTGTVAVANGNDGVLIQSLAAGNIVGGTVPGSGNVLSGNGVAGIVLTGTTGNSLLGNLVGTNAAGTAALGNGAFGLELVGAGSSGNTIGGSTPGLGNVFSGNAHSGIWLTGISNVFLGNKIGTNAAGTAAVPNVEYGLVVVGGSNTVGGTATGSGNVISGNGTAGVWLHAGGSNTVVGNLIGTDAGGSAAIPNGVGIQIDLYSSGNTIGGTSSGARNVISGNTRDGIVLTSLYAEHNVIEGNFIGTNAAGCAALPNGGNGVVLSGGVVTNTIGGTSAAAANVISGNAGAGVLITDAGTTLNTIQYNEIGTDAAGTSAIRNANGVVLQNGATANTILNNVISGNINAGVLFTDPATANNTLNSNLIGVDVSGTRIVPQPGQAYSNGVGVQFVNGTHNNIGYYDVISGNLVGVQFATGATADEIEDSEIGTDASGILNLGNLSDGVQFLHVRGDYMAHSAIYFNGGYGIYLSDPYTVYAGNGYGGDNLVSIVINGVTCGNKKGGYYLGGLG